MGFSLRSESVETTYQSATANYYRLTGGETYDLQLVWAQTPPASGSGTFRLTRQETYYTLTYRFDHPLVAKTWSYTGETVYTVDQLNMSIMPHFLGWSFTEGAQTPDVNEGDKLTLTQDTTLYAVCVPDTVLPADGSEARAEQIHGAFLYVLRPDSDGMYELNWQPDGDAGTSAYVSASLYDAAGMALLHADPQTAVTCALRGGETYYLYGEAGTPFVCATCKKTSDRVTAVLTFSVGKKAWLDLTLRGKTTYTVPDDKPAALDGREFLGWEDESRWRSYAPGDTIVITADTVLTAQWSHVPEERGEIARAVVNWVPNVVRALWQNLWLRTIDRFTK